MSALTQGSRVKVRHLVRDAHGRWSTIWKYGAIVGFGLHTDPVVSILKSTYVRVQMDEGTPCVPYAGTSGHRSYGSRRPRGKPCAPSP